MSFKDAGHLFRLASVFVIGTIVLLVARTVFVPRSFGEYGHYRGDALTEISAQPVVFAGHQACELCHSAVLETKDKGAHHGVNCEACHTALAKHVDDPVSVRPPKLDTAALCIRCHEVNGARPRDFPQIVTKEHDAGELACETCHQPHNPQIGAGAKP